MPPQHMQQMQQQPQGNWKDQLNLPVRDERYRTEVRALPTRRPTRLPNRPDRSPHGLAWPDPT